MSTALFPFGVWQSGTNENSIPANDNALRVEVLMGPAISVADSAPGSPSDGDQHVVGTTWGGHATDNVVIYKGGVWHEFDAFEGWVKVIAGVQSFFDGSNWVAGGGGGSGNVVGPASSVADQIAVFDATTGKLLKDGGKTIAALRSPNVQTGTSSGTVTPTFSNDAVKITAQAAALTLANPTGTAIDSLGMTIRIKDNGTARAISYGSQYRAIGVTLATTTVVSKTLYLAMIYNSEDTTWDIVAVGQQA